MSKNIYELVHKQDLKDLKFWPLLVVRFLEFEAKLVAKLFAKLVTKLVAK